MKHLRYFLWAIKKAAQSAFCRHRQREYRYTTATGVSYSRCTQCGIHIEEAQS